MALWLGFYSWVLAWLLLPAFLDMLTSEGLVSSNFQGKRISAGGGAFLLCINILALVTTIPFFWPQWQNEGLTILFFFSAVAFLGLLDDVVGSETVRGFKGHLALVTTRGQFTTGFLKAVGGGLIAFFTAWILNRNGIILLLDGLLLALALNGENLLDLRPGRAAKVFLVVFIISWLLTTGPGPWNLLLALVGAVVAYLPWDLKGKVMLGDVGSNLLGAGLGLLLVWNLEPLSKVIVVLLLGAVNLVSENYSLTKAIERIPVLAFFDRLGRE